jgi:Transglycosylase-like domain
MASRRPTPRSMRGRLHPEVIRDVRRKLMLMAGAAAMAAVPSALAADDQAQSAPSAAPLIPKPFDAASLRRQAHRAERRAQRRRRKAAATQVSQSPQLQAIANCESHGDPRAVGGGGQFRGKYQFTYSTWAAVGGHGDPAAAPESEQDRRAAMLYARSGPGQWPVCGS